MLKGIPRLGRAALFAVLLSFAVSGQNAPPPWINDEYRNNNYPQHKVGYAEGIVKKGEKGEKGETIEESRERLKLEAVKDLSMSIEARIIGSTSVDGKSHREGNVETITRDIQKMASSKTDTKLSGVEYSTYYEDARNKNKKWYVLAKVKTADLTARYSATADNSLLHAQHILKDMEDLYKRKMYNDVKTKSKERMAKALVECEWYVGLLGAVAPQSAEYKRLSDGFYSVRSGNDNILARIPTEKQIAVYTVGNLEETEKKILTDKMSAALKNLKDSPYQPIEDEKLQSRANKYKGGSVDSLQAEISNMASAQYLCKIEVTLTTDKSERQVSAVILEVKDGKGIRKESGEAKINSDKVKVDDLQRAVDEITAKMGFKKTYTKTELELEREKAKANIKALNNLFTDPRGNRTYRTVTIGGKRWFAENLDYGAAGSKCYGDKSEYCKKYGRLYDWETAMEACPAGWHVPTGDEWKTLYDNVGGIATAGTKLKSRSGWSNNGNGTDDFGFTALPGGCEGSECFATFNGDNGGYGWWWSASETDSDGALYIRMAYDREQVDGNIKRKSSLLSVRCVESDSAYRRDSLERVELRKALEEMNKGLEREQAEKAKKDSLAAVKKREATIKANGGTITDKRDGKKYRTIKIGQQKWLSENLNYDDGKGGSKCYENKQDYCAKYGRLYTWDDAMKACPAGWHVPKIKEWWELINYVGGEAEAGKKFKSTSGWGDDGNGTDEYGFSALPGGFGQSDDGNFYGVSIRGYWWSATEYNDLNAWIRYMNYDIDSMGRQGGGKTSYLFSVRCIENDSAYNRAEAERIKDSLESEEQSRALSLRGGVLGIVSGRIKGKSIASADIFGKGGFANDIDAILSGVGGLKSGGDGGVGRKGVAGIGYGSGYGSGFGGGGGGIDDLLGGLMGGGGAGLDIKKRGELKVSSPDFLKGGALTGGRSRASIQRVVMQNMAALRYAYNRRLRDKPGLNGKITVKFAIDEYGKVIFAQVVESTMDDSELERTVVDRVKSWNFDKIDKPGDVTEVVYPFVFSQ